MSSSKLKVAVTGGSGKIGRAVVRELVERGHQVLNLDRRQSPDKLAPFVYLDISAREQLQPVLEKVDAVIHLAEITHSSAPYSPDEIFWRNIRSASTVLQTAADLELKRAIYTSTCQVYGCWDRPLLPPERLPFDETLPLKPQNVYALSKTTNERFAELVARQTQLSIAIFRLPWVIVDDNVERWFGWVERDTGAIDGFGTYIHATDAARAYALALENPRPGCEAYHFTAAEIISSVPLAERLANMPDHPPLPPDWPGWKSPVLMDKAREHFGWEPKWNLMRLYRQWKAR